MAVKELGSIAEVRSTTLNEMERLAKLLPEYEIVRAIGGAGGIYCPQLIAEIGDIRKFRKKSCLVSFAGMEPPPCQSGKFESNKRHISKQGSPHLRRVLFQICDGLLKGAPPNDPVYQYLDRKRTEGKNYYSYMTAAGSKFLRIYYARVTEMLNLKDSAQ
ncbi:hypothetical protein FACS1894219_08620 [Clostridia bacterium]|nr:hypothetical protein FACS1894219_08620 [Clostridia bacterium]